VVPVEASKEEESEAMIQGAVNAAIREGFARISDKVVVVAGLPVRSPFSTNSIRVHVIGNILNRGERGFGEHCTGRIVKAKDPLTASLIMKKGGGEILLTHTLDSSFVPIVPMLQGIILEGTSDLSNEELQRLNPKIVCIMHTMLEFNCNISSFDRSDVPSRIMPWSLGIIGTKAASKVWGRRITPSPFFIINDAVSGSFAFTIRPVQRSPNPRSPLFRIFPIT
jgi:hypothetical protein